MKVSFVEGVVGACARYAGFVVPLFLVLGIAGAYFSATHFRMNSDTAALISSTADWRKREIAFDAAFPQQKNLIDIVIDGATPERAEEAASALSTALSTNKRLFLSVRRPDGGPFLAHNALLFLPRQDVRATTEQMIAAQPFLGALAADPSLRGVMDSISTVLTGVQHGQTSLATIDKSMTALAATLEKVTGGKTAFLSWQELVTGKPGDLRQTQRFIEVQPRLNFKRLMPGERATDAIRAAAQALHLTPENGVRVRLTGPVPMADDEFSTLTDRARLMATLMMVAILVMLWLAVRSFRIVFSILLTVFSGLAVTTAIGLLVIGAFNVISVAFIALFVGLGVDFGIQFSVRYRAERHEHDDLDLALRGAGAGVGGALTLAAIATAAGFLSFLPTSYAGVAELGFVAGVGMLVTYALTITFLPALLKLLSPPGEPAEIGLRGLASLDSYLTNHSARIVTIAVIMGVLGLAALPWLTFDFNPLDLRSPKVESVATALDLMKNPTTSPNTIDVMAKNQAQARSLAARLAKLPQVSRVMTVESFIPEDQQAKLALIADASTLLETTIDPFMTKPPPSDAETVASLKSTADQLRMAAATDKTQAGSDAQRLASVLDKLARGTPDARKRAEFALVPGLKTMLTQMQGVLQAQPVTFQTIPRDLARDWVTPDGQYRIRVSPRGNANDNKVLRRFTQAIRSVTPAATGVPITIQAAGSTIVRAFIQAGVLSFLSIVILLAVAPRSLLALAMALAPLVLAGILTLATCVVIGQQLNYANIIALPLLFGIGVAFDIYFVQAWRAGGRNLLQSPLTRAVIMSAGTTASAFGTLWLSSHPGTASTGELLAISLIWILAAVLFLLPALLARFAPEAGLPARKV